MFKAANVIILVFAFNLLYGQHPVIAFKSELINEQDLLSLKETYGNNKQLPIGYEKQALLALSFFPELKDISIEFKVAETMTPLTSRPTIWSVFRSPKNRHYLITISSKSKGIMDSILLGNLNYNAQIGVLAHELSHVSDYNTKNIWQFLRIGIGLLSKSYMDAFEYNTDQICIDHAAGYQLLAWSKNTRLYFTKETVEKYFGKDALTNERYMTPETIQQKINEHPLYQNIKL